MRNNHPLLILSLIFFSAYILSAQEVIPTETQQKVKQIYELVDATLRNESKTYRSIDTKSLSFENIEVLPEPWTPKTFTDGSLEGAWMQVWADGFRLRLVNNLVLKRLLDQKKITQQVPNYTLNKAVDAAKTYLNSFHIQLSPNLELTTVSFNRNYPACWEIRWTRVADGYPWDYSDVVAQQESLVVVFHEKEGLLFLENDIYSPLPKSLHVVMTREQAISKAAKCAPLVEHTPFYKSARMDGFVISELKSCDLKIAIPNYLLDPQRANWPPQTPPNETRLCWVVRFTTVDSKADQRNMQGKLIPPDIIVYLDAATGECVGANFS